MINKLLSIIIALGIFIWNPYPLQIAELKTYDWLIMNTEQVQESTNFNRRFRRRTLSTNTEVGRLPRSVYGDLITTTNAIPGITVLMPNKDIRGKDYDDILLHENVLQTNSPCYSSIDTSNWLILMLVLHN